MGGDALLNYLTHHPADTLYLDIPAGDPAHLVAWEFATLPDGAFLVCRTPFLRLVTDRPSHTRPPSGFLQFLAVGADPLVNMAGHPRDEVYQLKLNPEMKQISRALKESGQALVGKRLPPTAEALRQALGRPQPALLHLSCHGSIHTTPTGRATPVLHLEDHTGREANLFGPDLLNLTSHNNLLLVLLSACHTSTGYTNLTEQLVRHGVPAAVGMQGAFPDDLSDDLAVALYTALLAGHTLGQALRQARLALHRDGYAVGLPVGYVVRGGDAPLPLVDGFAKIQLDLAHKVQLPPELTPPRPLLGRHLALHELATMLSEPTRVVTITGTGGIGKTALSASFAERFGWRWPEGVVGFSFANSLIDGVQFRQALAQGITKQLLPDVPAEQQEAQLLAILKEWEGLLLIDNYESVQERVAEGRAEAMAIHRLLNKMAQGGASLLLTSRNQPIGLAGEKLFPHFDRPLPGLAVEPGQRLFFHHSTKAKAGERNPAIQQLAEQIAQLTAGHPLAIALLAGEFDHSEVSPADFLANWGEELQAATQPGRSNHHVTLAVAFERSYRHLTAAQQTHLRLLAVLPVPFFAQAAAELWQTQEEDDEDLSHTRQLLRGFLERSLLEVEGFFEDNRPATYRFQPALWQEVASRLTPEERELVHGRLGAYLQWFSNLAYGTIHQEGQTALNRLALQMLPVFTDHLALVSGVKGLWHKKRVGWLLKSFGQTHQAQQLLIQALSEAEQETSEAGLEVYASLLFEAAGVEMILGRLDKALQLYQQSLLLQEQVGDIKDSKTTLHQIANILVSQEQLDEALIYYQQALPFFKEKEHIRNLSSTLHNMGVIFHNKGQLNLAIDYYERSYLINKQLKDINGTSAILLNLADISMNQGEWDKAEQLVQEALMLGKEFNSPKHIAFSEVKLGQVAQGKEDFATAQTQYETGLALFRQLGMMREVAQVEELLQELQLQKLSTNNKPAIQKKVKKKNKGKKK